MISVVIPLWNKAPYVGRCLDSVLAQTFTDFEVVVVDDGSTDDGPAIVDAVDDSRVRLVRQPNGGVSVARNRGVTEARGEWVAFLDADDEWMPDHLAVLDDLMRRYPTCGLVSASYWLLRDSDGIRRRPVLEGVDFEGEDGVMDNYYEVAAGVNAPVNMNTFAVRRDVFVGCGGFPTGVKSGEDTYTIARLFAETDLAYSLRPTSVYHLFTEGKNYRAFLRRNPVDDLFDGLVALGRNRRGVRRFVAAWHKQRMTHSVHCGEPGTAVRQFVRAVSIYPFQKKIYLLALLSLISAVTGRDIYELIGAFGRKGGRPTVNRHHSENEPPQP